MGIKTRSFNGNKIITGSSGGLCLPSDNKMTPEQQDAIIQTIRECFE